MKYSAILFDLDGTLVETIGLYEETFCNVIHEFGGRIDHFKFVELYGQGLHLHEFIGECGIDPSKEGEVRKARDESYVESLSRRASWIPKAEEALKHFAERTSIGVVTGSWKSYVDAIDERLKFENLFDCCITADQTVGRHKPDPQGLLLGALSLEVDPSECLYVGDQHVDTVAAKGAGMDCCLIPSTYTPKDAHGEATMIIDSIGDLKNHL